VSITGIENIDGLCVSICIIKVRGSSIRMQPARLGGLWCFGLSTLLGLLALAPSSPAQAVLQTPQQTNDRIRELSATAARSAPHDYVIGTGDVLSIDVFDVKELSRDVRVSQTGTISIPLVPVRLHVAGLTEAQTEQKIAEVLEANGLVTHPDVSVMVKERRSKPITVVGAVNHPLVYEAERPVTLLEVIAEAGGLSTDAGSQVIVTRPVPAMTFDETEPPAIGSDDPAATNVQSTPHANQKSSKAEQTSTAPSSFASGIAAPLKAEPPDLNSTSNQQSPFEVASAVPTDMITVNLNDLVETGSMKNNIMLQAGDVVTVPHAGIVYVLGAVGRPGGFVLTDDREQLTALKILALAGGFTSTAKSSHAVVMRKDAQGKQQQLIVDLKKIRNGKAEDMQLRPSDILYVPSSNTKTVLLRSVEFGLALGSALALYRVAYQ
jgi:polysaccharide biosynthesis/export protein